MVSGPFRHSIIDRASQYKNPEIALSTLELIGSVVICDNQYSIIWGRCTVASIEYLSHLDEQSQVCIWSAF